jgi:hypothetical protein
MPDDSQNTEIALKRNYTNKLFFFRATAGDQESKAVSCDL